MTDACGLTIPGSLPASCLISSNKTPYFVLGCASLAGLVGV